MFYQAVECNEGHWMPLERQNWGMILQLQGIQGKVVRENVRHIHVENERTEHEVRIWILWHTSPDSFPSPYIALKICN